MTISSPNFTRLQDGIQRADDLRVRGPLNVALSWLSGGLVTQLNTHFGEVSNSISNFISVYASTRPTFLAHKNGVNQTSISASIGQITFGTEDWDIGGFYASNAWTPPAGKYRLTVAIEWTATGAVDNEQLTILLLKNGGGHRSVRHIRPGTAEAGWTDSFLVDANGTDAFTIFATKSGAGVGEIIGAATRTWFCGEDTA